MASDDALPSEPIELDEAAHTLLCGARSIVVGRAECPAVRRMFADLCGPAADQALNMLFVFVKQLALKGQRRLTLHMPGCCAISGDELALLSSIAAAQAASGEEDDRTRRCLSCLTGGAADQGLARSLRCLAALLAEAGCKVAVEASIGARTVH